jgi:hypothetical protein
MRAFVDAKRLFLEAGLGFPAVPLGLAARLEQHGPWTFATRQLEVWPYDFDHYVAEGHGPVADHVVLAHAGHGANSHAIHYYLVQGPLRLFLQLGWGGIHMDAGARAASVRACFARADELVRSAAVGGRVPAGHRLTVAASDFYGAWWQLAPAATPYVRRPSLRLGVAGVLAEALHALSGDRA